MLIKIFNGDYNEIMRFEKVVTHVSNEKPRCFACECPFLLLDPDLAQQNTRSDMSKN